MGRKLRPRRAGAPALGGPGQLSPAEDPYDLDRFTAELGMSAERRKAIVAQLRRKGQIVLEGPPGKRQDMDCGNAWRGSWWVTAPV